MKAIQLIKLLFSKYFFGFINGHYYLSSNQISQIYTLIFSSKKRQAQIIKKFETKFSKIIGTGNSISFAAGRMGFYSLMKTLELGNEDQVIIQSSNCAVMVNAILKIGAKPIFADIDINTLGTSPESVEKLITQKTKLIVAQHSFGIPCEIDRIIALASKNNIFVLEDCALAVGSEYKGVKVGNWGNAALFSFDHSKPINCFIGGMLYFKDKLLYKKLLKYRNNLPSLTLSHQVAIFKTFLFENRYFNPRGFAKGKILLTLTNLLNKFKIRKNVFLTDDYGPPSGSKNSNYPYPSKIPAFIAQIGLFELDRFGSNKKQRAQILSDYIKATRNNKLIYLPKAYFNPHNVIIPLRLIGHFYNEKSPKSFLLNHYDIYSSWFLEPLVACNDPQDLGYTYGTCLKSELSCQTIINFPCTFDYKYIDKFLSPLITYLNQSKQD